MQAPFSLASQVNKVLKDWKKNNLKVKQYALGLIGNELHYAAFHPVRYICFILLFFLSYSFLLLALVSLGWVDLGNLDFFRTQAEGKLKEWPLSSVWAIQATIAAMVYPFVISFVSLLLQRRTSSKALLQIYLIHSSALFSGTSSLILVFVIALQYVASLRIAEPTILQGIFYACTYLWFGFNLLITLRFLYRTINFLNDDEQNEVVYQYLINVSLPEYLHQLVESRLYDICIKNGWYADSDTGGTNGPFIMYFDISKGAPAQEIKRHSKFPVQLIDIRFRLLSFSLKKWLAKARAYQPNSQNDSKVSSMQSKLIIHAWPGSKYQGEVKLVSVKNGPKIGWLDRQILYRSFKFAKTKKNLKYVSVSEVIKEHFDDLRVKVQDLDLEGFREANQKALNLYHFLVKACQISIYKELEVSNLAHLHIWTQKEGWVFDEFLCNYRSVFSAAVGVLHHDANPIKDLCALGFQLGCEDDSKELKGNLLSLSYIFFQKIAEWWAKSVEEQGQLQHDRHYGIKLQPPLMRAYEDLLAEFAGDWDTNRRVNAQIHDEDVFDWQHRQVEVDLHADHLLHTAILLLEAIDRGDQTAAEWFADVLVKWPMQVSGYKPLHYLVQENATRISLDTFYEPWVKIKEYLIPAENVFYQTSLSDAEWQEQIARQALEAFWEQVMLLLSEILIQWAKPDLADSHENSLCLYILKGFYTRKVWRQGSQAGKVDLFSSTTDYLLLRLSVYVEPTIEQGRVSQKLDSFIHRVREINQPRMVSGRLYSSYELDSSKSLDDALIAALTVLSIVGWQPPSRYHQSLVNEWAGSSKAAAIIVDRLDELMHRQELATQLYGGVISYLTKDSDPVLSLEKRKKLVNELISKTRDELKKANQEKIRGTQIDDQALKTLAKQVSQVNFNKENPPFPVRLFSSIVFDMQACAGEKYSITLKNVRKELFIQADDARHQSIWFSEIAEDFGKRLTQILFSDILKSEIALQFTVNSGQTFWEVIKAESANLTTDRRTAILFVSRYGGSFYQWLNKWSMAQEVPVDKVLGESPEFLVNSDLQQNTPEYRYTISNVEVYLAPIPKDECWMLSKEDLESVSFGRFNDDSCVQCELNEVGSSVCQSGEIEGVYPLENSDLFRDLKMTFYRKVLRVGASLIKIQFDSGS